MNAELSAESDQTPTHWEQRKLAIIHDTALALSEGEWDALRWHFEQVWTEGWAVGLEQWNAGIHNPYRPGRA